MKSSKRRLICKWLIWNHSISTISSTTIGIEEPIQITNWIFFSLSFFFPWMISPSSVNGNQLILYKFYWYFYAKICCQALDSKLNGSCITFRSKSLAAVAMSKFAFAALRTYLKSLEICCINQWIKRQPYFIRLIIMREKEILFLLFCWNFISVLFVCTLLRLNKTFRMLSQSLEHDIPHDTSTCCGKSLMFTLHVFEHGWKQESTRIQRETSLIWLWTFLSKNGKSFAFGHLKK